MSRQILLTDYCTVFWSCKFTTSQFCFLNFDSPNVFGFSFLFWRDLSCNFERKFSVMYDLWLPLLNSILTVVDFVLSSFVATALAVCSKTLHFGFALSALVIAVVVPSVSRWSPDAVGVDFSCSLRGDGLLCNSGQIDWWCLWPPHFLQLFLHYSELWPFPMQVKHLLSRFRIDWLIFARCRKVFSWRVNTVWNCRFFVWSSTKKCSSCR